MNVTVLHQSLISHDDTMAVRDAVIWSDGKLTHGELRMVALRIATRLRSLGIGSGHRVAICLPKCVEAVQAICGVLACGAAYVPMDAMSPPTRLQKILIDGNPSLLITTEAVREKLNCPVNILTLPLCGDGNGFAEWLLQTSAEPLPEVSLDDPAAILYTSGSTGSPKGVMLSHRNISSFVRWAVDRFDLRETDRFASHAPFHFDLSTLDLFAPLQTGGAVFLLDEKTVRFPVSVAKALERQQISILYAVPTALGQLVESGILEKTSLPALRRVFFAGEVFPLPSLRVLMDKWPRVKFTNFYGPTETNVCCFHELDCPPTTEDFEIPIGRACPYFQVVLLDDSDHESTEGEICVTGCGVMQGYWNDESKTERSRWRSRLDSYRTGDFGRRGADGRLYFMGRRDQQVKVRGYRVELMEIDAILSQHPQVAQTAAIFINNAIVAFVAARDGSQIAEDEVRAWCVERLLAHAVPGSFIFISALPQTATGKLDRQWLNEKAFSVAQVDL